MRPLLTTFACLVLLSGCSTRRGARTTMATGAVTMLAGLVVAGAVAEQASGEDLGTIRVMYAAAPFAVTGTLLVLGAAINLVVLDVMGSTATTASAPGSPAPPPR